RGPQRPAHDALRRAHRPGPLLHPSLRRRDGGGALGARVSDQAVGEQPALRPHVRVHHHHRCARLARGRAPSRGRPAARALAGAARVRRVLPFIVPGAVLLVWELAAQNGTISRIVCPSLLAIARELGSFLIRSDRLVEAWLSLYRALAGFALAALVGVPLGLALGRSRRAARIVDPLLSATYPVPKIALFPVLVFALGIGSLSKITLVLLECLYPIVINAAQGARAVNRVLVWSSHNMGASRLQILGKIVLPAAAPPIFTG